MKRISTHYDNLKVARNAPIEVVRAAYGALAKKYHPDVSTAPDAERVMRLLNQAWAVLRDPERRAQHDRWITRQEAGIEAERDRILQRQAVCPCRAFVGNGDGRDELEGVECGYRPPLRRRRAPPSDPGSDAWCSTEAPETQVPVEPRRAGVLVKVIKLIILAPLVLALGLTTVNGMLTWLGSQ